MVNLEINMGKHTMKVPYGAKKMFLDLIEKSLEIEQGSFKVHLGKNIRGSNKKDIKLIRPLPEFNALSLKAQPSGKDGKHEWILYFPDMYKDRLQEFAKTLKKKIGQEDLVDDEVINEEQKEEQKENAQDGSVLPVIELGESVLFRQQQYEEERHILEEMPPLIVAEIFDKKGTAWIPKRDVFKVVYPLKLQCAPNKLIGKLFKLGYLEDDTDNPHQRCRLTQAACLLIGRQSISEEDSRILSAVESLRIEAGECVVLSAELEKNCLELEKLNAKKIYLTEKLEKVIQIVEERRKKNEEMILMKENEINLLHARITPRMIEANRRLELIFVELPAE